MPTAIKQNLVIHIIFIAFLTAVGCTNQQNKYTSKWPSIGEPFDSLVDRLEWQFNNFTSFDSISFLIERMDSITLNDTMNYMPKKSRTLYWKARLLSKLQYQDSSIQTAKQALVLNDSINYKYDYYKILNFMYAQIDTINRAKEYKHYEKCMDYAKEIGDIGLEASTSTYLGILMNKLGENNKAIAYYSLADSLNSYLGNDVTIIKNKINIAKALNDMGCVKKSDSILKSLIDHPALKNDTFTMNCVSRNLYAFTNDKTYLITAFNQIKDIERFNYLKGLYASLLIIHNYNNECFDSIEYYSELAYRYLPFMSDYNHKAIAWFGLSQSWYLTNNIDSAFVCRLRYEAYVDSLHRMYKPSEALRLSALHEIDLRESAYKVAQFKLNMIVAFVILVTIALTTVFIQMLKHKNMRQRMAAMKNELELEKAKRKIAATTLTIEEKDNMLTAIRSELSEMRQEGEIKEGSARKLESTIKSHLLESDNEETFREMFDVVNPGFTERLREQCPNLADSYVKLASYILMELDNKRIASLMMIKPESVHQARWRLRQRLKIPADQSIRYFLNDLNKKL